jgi:hypothetical protein
MILYDFYHHSSINESFKNETKINNFFFLYFFFHEQNVYEYSEQKKQKKIDVYALYIFCFRNPR